MIYLYSLIDAFLLFSTHRLLLAEPLESLEVIPKALERRRNAHTLRRRAVLRRQSLQLENEKLNTYLMVFYWSQANNRLAIRFQTRNG